MEVNGYYNGSEFQNIFLCCNSDWGIGIGPLFAVGLSLRCRISSQSSFDEHVGIMVMVMTLAWLISGFLLDWGLGGWGGG